ncbi:MAG: protein kinase [Lachnospiraceae bacterium]|nr:protein kinase [Lachnospiraceae bacterium]
MLEIGSIVDGKYKILSVIGKGGMSVVYLALNERANKTWAIKEVRKDGKQDFEVVKQGLVVETDLLKKLHHPNLPSIVDVIDGDGSFLIVMDYIEGSPLSDYVKNGPLAQEDVIEWSKQLCEVLSYLHSRKPAIIYRDMKPSNIMLKPDGTVTVIDFGIAREYKEGNVADTSVLGTRGYAAPEQYGNMGQTDPRTDIYALGATMYHLVTGHSPAEYPYEMYPIRHWNSSLSSGLEEIILKCTKNRPEYRYQNCAELIYALEHYDELDSVYKNRQNRKWRTFLVSAIVTGMAGIGAFGFHMAENKVTASTYEAYLADAEGITDEQTILKDYENAIKLNPSDGTAYLAMLDAMYGNDGDFSSEEETTMREIINYTGDTNRTNLEYLSRNTDDYNKFAYEMGMAYFYFYEEKGNKSASTRWLSIASEATPSGELSSKEIERAKKLYKIAGYYDSLGVTKKTGDTAESYLDFWTDMVGLTDGEADNTVTELITYKELTVQIYNHAVDFKTAGVTRDKIQEQLDKARRILSTVKLDAGNEAYETELIEKIQNNIENASDSVTAAFDVSGAQTAEVEVDSNGTSTTAD